ncbi:MAG: hypothetical protein U0574_00030 [Phycisphaerales bacterium]
MTLRDRLRHAFALDPPGPATPTPEQAEVIDRLLREVVRRRMVLPAAMFLESVRPLGYVGSQAMHFFSPFATALISPAAYQAFATFLEARGAVDHLLNRLAALELEAEGEAKGEAKGEPKGEAKGPDPADPPPPA